MTDIVFMDTETLGLDIDAPIWEFAAIRRSVETGKESRLHLFIDHSPDSWIASPDLPAEFIADYKRRYRILDSCTRELAADLISSFLDGRPHIIGAVPNFDQSPAVAPGSHSRSVALPPDRRGEPGRRVSGRAR
jgi:hypothetical protein